MRVLKTLCGMVPSATATASPYPSPTASTTSYSCRVKSTPASSSAVTAAVDFDRLATTGARLPEDQPNSCKGSNSVKRLEMVTTQLSEAEFERFDGKSFTDCAMRRAPGMFGERGGGLLTCPSSCGM